MKLTKTRFFNRQNFSKAFRIHLAGFLLLIFCGGLTAQTVTEIQVQNPLDIAALDGKTFGTDGDPIHLHILYFEKFKSEQAAAVSNAPWISKVRYLTVRDMKIEAKALQQILNAFEDGQLLELNLIGLDYKGDELVFHPTMVSELRTLRLNHFEKLTKLSAEFYSHLAMGKFPKLSHLELVNAGLTLKFIEAVEDKPLIQPLEYLDLSYNPLGNAVFRLFETTADGNIHTLKLNGCDLNFVAPLGYLVIDKEGKKQVEAYWESPIFRKLKHLELQNDSHRVSAMMTLINIPTINKLDVFLGFTFSTAELANLTDDKKLEIERDYYRRIPTAPMASRLNNFRFSKLFDLQNLLNSTNSKTMENLILSGLKWHEVTIRTLLANLDMPALKSITLEGANIEQPALYQLLQDYPQYQFDIYYYEKITGKTELAGHWVRGRNGQIINVLPKREFSPRYWPEVIIYQK